ncbi:MerC domain-containing protein [Novosphingobium sp. PS1R-30]|uniref:MerC domain-containing protein n=1 Tax=Novosphingobium anseongense TaxID=3133436 RepID=A0ABU8RVP4_9SPHN|nr:MAG: MerC domain-containing protein [Novosphingobium sp.]
MTRAILSIRDRLDRVGMLLSGLCALHCIAGIVLVSVLGLGGQALLAPAIHEIGLLLAIVVGIFTLGLGVLRHGRAGPLLIGGAGLALMTSALFVGHGLPEAVLTIAGVALVATAHIRNLRHAA